MSVHQHHTLFYRRVHNAMETTRDIRNNRWLIVPITEESHVALHKEVPMVPLLDWRTAARVRDRLPEIVEPGQFVENIGRLCMAIEEELHNPRTGQLARDVGALTIQAIEMQVPFIEEGLMWRRGIRAA